MNWGVVTSQLRVFSCLLSVLWARERYPDYSYNNGFMSLIQSNIHSYFITMTITITVVIDLRCGYWEKRSYSKFVFHEMKTQQHSLIQQAGQSFVPLISLVLHLKCRLLIIILKGNVARKDSLWRWLVLLARQLNLTVKAAKRRVVCFYWVGGDDRGSPLCIMLAEKGHERCSRSGEDLR